MPPTRTISQNFVDTGGDHKLDVTLIKMCDLNKDYADLRAIVERNEGSPLGLSGTFLRNGTLRVLAIADATSVILIDFPGVKNIRRVNSSNPSSITPGYDYLRDHVLGRTCGFLYAFDMGPLALALWLTRDLRIKQAIDIQSGGSPKTRAPLATIKFAAQDKVINEGNITRAFRDFVCKSPKDVADTATTTPLAQRAWIAHYVSQLACMEDRLSQVPPIDTVKLPDAVIYFISFSLCFRLMVVSRSLTSWLRLLQMPSEGMNSSRLRLLELTIHLLMTRRSNSVLKQIVFRTKFTRAKIK